MYMYTKNGKEHHLWLFCRISLFTTKVTVNISNTAYFYNLSCYVEKFKCWYRQSKVNNMTIHITIIPKFFFFWQWQPGFVAYLFLKKSFNISLYIMFRLLSFLHYQDCTKSQRCLWYKSLEKRQITGIKWPFIFLPSLFNSASRRLIFMFNDYYSKAKMFCHIWLAATF